MMQTDAYKFMPSGHKALGTKRSYTEPSPALKRKFGKWLDDIKNNGFYLPRNYEKALDMAKNMECSVEEAHALPLAYYDHPKIADAGLFISALYNRCISEREIVFDADLGFLINWLGYKLPKEKTLVVLSDVDAPDFLGSDSYGTIICYRQCPHRSKGVVVNYADYKEIGFDGDVVNLEKTMHISGRFVLNFGETHSVNSAHTKFTVNAGKSGHFFPTGIVIMLNDSRWGYDHTTLEYILKETRLFLDSAKSRSIPELMEYVDSLKQRFESGRSDYRNVLSLLNELGPEPTKRIEEDVLGILRRAGYNV